MHRSASTETTPQIQISEPLSSPPGTSASANNDSATSREKRVRKQKIYDEDFVVFPPKSTQTNQTDTTINNNSILKDAAASLSMEDTSSSSDLMLTKYQVGDLVWAKVSGHPWWPCMVSRDTTADATTHCKEVGTTRTKRTFYVEFFGPAVEHAWVAEGCLIEYKGIEAFKTYAQDQVDQAPTKSQKEKLAERFQLKVALTRRDHWEKAVEEADKAISMPRGDRANTFFTNKTYNRCGSSQKETAPDDTADASRGAADDESENEENVTPNCNGDDKASAKSPLAKKRNNSDDNLKNSGVKRKVIFLKVFY